MQLSRKIGHLRGFLGWTVFLRPRFIDRHDALRKETLMPSEQLVHYSDDDASCEADFPIEFHVHV